MDVSSTQKAVALDLAASTRKAVSVGKPVSPVELETSPQSQEKAAREQIEVAVVALQEFAQTVRRDLNFSVDDGSGQVVVKVTDSTSGDVIRQIPSEEALQLAEHLSDVRSLLFKAKA